MPMEAAFILVLLVCLARLSLGSEGDRDPAFRSCYWDCYDRTSCRSEQDAMSSVVTSKRRELLSLQDKKRDMHMIHLSPLNELRFKVFMFLEKYFNDKDCDRECRYQCAYSLEQNIDGGFAEGGGEGEGSSARTDPQPHKPKKYFGHWVFYR